MVEDLRRDGKWYEFCDTFSKTENENQLHEGDLNVALMMSIKVKPSHCK